MKATLRKLAEHTVPLVIVVLLMGGSAVAGGLITGSQIEDGSVTGKDIRNGSLTPADFGESLMAAGAGSGGKGEKGTKGQTGAGAGSGPKGAAACRTLLACGGKGEEGAPKGAGAAPIKGEKGEKGPKGAKGLAGDKGDPGTPGTPGAPGAAAVTAVPGIEQVAKRSEVSTATPKEVILTCPKGPVLSGGFVLYPDQSVNLEEQKHLRVIRSYAVDANSWLVRAVNDASFKWELTVVATCATG